MQLRPQSSPPQRHASSNKATSAPTGPHLLTVPLPMGPWGPLLIQTARVTNNKFMYLNDDLSQLISYMFTGRQNMPVSFITATVHYNSI